MTCVVAAKKGSVISIAADSLVTLDPENNKFTGIANESKIIHATHFRIGYAGYGPIKHILELLLDTAPEDSPILWKSSKINNQRTAHEFMESYCDLFTEKLGEDYDNKTDLLIVTKDHIFCCFPDEVYEIGTYWSIGSGSPYALGKMHGLYEEVEPGNLPMLTKAAVDSAINFSSSCGGPIQEFNYLNLERS
jgi:ATP-dependent protease HslVU (ClpYQ) peptidase subunit